MLKAPSRLPVDMVPTCSREPPPKPDLCRINTVEELTKAYETCMEGLVADVCEATGTDNDDKFTKLRGQEPTFFEVDAFVDYHGYPAANAAARKWRDRQGNYVLLGSCF